MRVNPKISVPRSVRDFHKAFGERVRLVRYQLRYDQAVLALELGITQAYLSKIERGECDIPLCRAAHIAHVLGTTLPDLLEGLI